MIFESERNADKLKFVLFGFQGKLLPLFILFAECGRSAEGQCMLRIKAQNEILK